jgi:hypothetical protein
MDNMPSVGFWLVGMVSLLIISWRPVEKARWSGGFSRNLAISPAKAYLKNPLLDCQSFFDTVGIFSLIL